MKGHLVIAGGNIKSNSIYERFIELAGGDRAKIAIVPTATTEIERAFKNHTETFVNCGVKEDRIICIKVDPEADPGSSWKRRGDDFENLDFLDDVTGVWFVGGDQIRILNCFKRKNGEDTKLLHRLRSILETGGVIGGSSAGAAIMSEIMIGGGTSFGALCMPGCRNYNDYMQTPELEGKGVLFVTEGLGFFKEGIVDQHFDKRSRIGRLLETMFFEKVSKGFGIAEDTAAVYHIESRLLERVGSGEITILDISEASRSKTENFSRITNVKISCMARKEDVYKAEENKLSLGSKVGETYEDYSAFKNYLLNISFADGAEDDSFDEYRQKESKVSISSGSDDKLVHYMKNHQTINKEISYDIVLYRKREEAKGSSNRSGSFADARLDIIPVVQREEFLQEEA